MGLQPHNQAEFIEFLASFGQFIKINQKRKITFLGHAMRRNGIENLLLGRVKEQEGDKEWRI